MWITTTFGFFSIVEPPGKAGGKLVVRTRTRKDLNAFLDRAFSGKQPPIVADKKGVRDYQFRAMVPRKNVAKVLALAAAEIDYSNFKDTVARRQGYERAYLYERVWADLRDLPLTVKKRRKANDRDDADMGKDWSRLGGFQ